MDTELALLLPQPALWEVLELTYEEVIIYIEYIL
jgi:hypothetical protein